MKIELRDGVVVVMVVLEEFKLLMFTLNRSISKSIDLKTSILSWRTWRGIRRKQCVEIIQVLEFVTYISLAE